MPSPQGTPLRLKSVGVGAADRQVPWRPNAVPAPLGRAAFQSVPTAVTERPVWVTVAFQAEVTSWSPP